METTTPKPKKRISSEMLIALAAVIASIALPLAQFFVGYIEQKTAQEQNVRLEEERRKLEITKLFMDNYVGKTDEVQIATIQIMKTLDPHFFISIESGLKEATSSDAVKKSLRKATLEAATEIHEGSPNRPKSKKIEKALTASELERQGFELLQKGDVANAQKKFDEANTHFPNHITTKDGSASITLSTPLGESTELSDLEKASLKDFYRKNKQNLDDSTRKVLRKQIR